MTHFYSIPILIFLRSCGRDPSGIFNVMEEKRQNETSENRKYYRTADYLDVSGSAAAVRLCAALPRILSNQLHLLVWRSVFCLSRISFPASRRIKLAVLVAVVEWLCSADF